MCAGAVIADDLTGANAAGSLLAGKGLRVLTSLGLEGFKSSRSDAFDAVCVSTDSRLLAAEAARAAVRDAVSAFMPLRPKVVTKRIASTLRGNVGAEIEAALEAMGSHALAVARRLGAVGFSVRDEVLPLAVYGRLVQGLCHDLPIVTKGGFVGDTQSLVQCVHYLKTKISTRTKHATTEVT